MCARASHHSCFFPSYHAFAGVLLKQDLTELDEGSLNQTVSYANSFNQQQPGSLELLVGKKVQRSPTSPLEDEILTDLSLCGSSAGRCGGRYQSFGALDSALAGGTGLTTGTDYRGTTVMSAYSYSVALGAGVVYKIDLSEVTQPILIRVMILALAAVGTVTIGCLVLHLAARRLLSSIEKTWEDSKKAVQEQKVLCGRGPNTEDRCPFFVIASVFGLFFFLFLCLW